MDEFTADAFANRDEPVPLLTVTQSDVELSASDVESEGKRRRVRKSLSPSRLRDKASDYASSQLDKAESHPDIKLSIQDRLFSRILSGVIPSEDVVDDSSIPDRRSSKYVRRPAFSLPVMTSNFRRFNARIGIAFVFQNQMIRLFTWRQPTHTLSFLATYTFICLNPYLLAVLPLAITLLFIMVPAFISRHPPPPPTQTTSITTPYYSTYTGPALAPARTIKPASETSKDFFRNMRDLQNSMADFSNLHDKLISLIAPATNFSDEILSSTIFLYLFLLTLLLFITSHLLPYRLILLVAGYTLTISAHPSVQLYLAKQHAKALSAPSSLTQPKFLGINLPAIPPRLHPLITTLSTITLDTTPSTRQVEIFELQHRPLSSLSHSVSVGEWQPHLYTPTPYDPLSPARISGDRPKGTRFFEDVSPPEGWEWHGKKWELDLEAGEWVNERLVVGVEYDVLSNQDGEDSIEGANSGSGRATDFGGWVWDLPPRIGEGGRDEEVWLAYGDYDVPSAKKEKSKKQKKAESRDWEESVRYGTAGRTGEWRRRRWVRMVRRKEIREHGL
jgi:hypothetical protein